MGQVDTFPMFTRGFTLPFFTGLAAVVLSAAPPDLLVDAALTQIGVTTHYDGAYTSMPYPGGDVPIDRGVCTDVLIRAYRKLGIDLQSLVHEDMAASWKAYPNPWRMKSTDRNIDHRRVPDHGSLSLFRPSHRPALIRYWPSMEGSLSR